MIIEQVNAEDNLDDIKFIGKTNNATENNNLTEGTNSFINGETSQLDESIDVTYTLGDSWYDGEKYHQMLTLNIQNNRETAITSWQIDLDRKKYNLQNVYNANYIEMETLLRFSNVSYNGMINPGNNVSFQIELTSTEKNFNISIVNITGSA